MTENEKQVLSAIYDFVGGNAVCKKPMVKNAQFESSWDADALETFTRADEKFKEFASSLVSDLQGIETGELLFEFRDVKLVSIHYVQAADFDGHGTPPGPHGPADCMIGLTTEGVRIAERILDEQWQEKMQKRMLLHSILAVFFGAALGAFIARLDSFGAFLVELFG